MTRKILHLDLDAFFCAVEEQRDPSLRGRAFAVGGRPEERRVMAVLHDLTPIVEQVSIDEAFLDVSGRREPAEELARGLQAVIRDELGLPCSLGVATNKLVAKIANNIGKARAEGPGPPNAITVVPPGEEAAFLAPLDVRELWGVGPRTAERLAQMGIHTI